MGLVRGDDLPAVAGGAGFLVEPGDKRALVPGTLVVLVAQVAVGDFKLFLGPVGLSYAPRLIVF